MCSQASPASIYLLFESLIYQMNGKYVHIVVPIYKSGDKTSVKNYRPISILSNIGKVLERIIFNKIINFATNKLSLFQFGAVKGRSPLQQLLLFLDNIYLSNSQTDAIYLDIRKAFDTIPHSKLLLRLYSLEYKVTCSNGSSVISLTTFNVYV